jgi:hypothetical protein
MRPSFATQADGARAILGEVLESFQRHAPDLFVIVGGWIPFLRCNGPIRHPGTRDVDVLCDLENHRQEVEAAVRDLIGRGYHLSAKHPFQLIRILDCHGGSLAFNVDLLYPGEKTDIVTFAKIFDFPVQVGPFNPSMTFAASIILPESKFLTHGWSETRMEVFQLPDGRIEELRVPLLNDIAFVFTKSDSWKRAKRDRDAFDIYLTLAQYRVPSTLRTAAERLLANHPETFATLLNRCAEMEETRFAQLVRRTSVEITVEEVQRTMHEFVELLRSLGANEPPAKLRTAVG